MGTIYILKMKIAQFGGTDVGPDYRTETLAVSKDRDKLEALRTAIGGKNAQYWAEPTQAYRESHEAHRRDGVMELKVEPYGVLKFNRVHHGYDIYFGQIDDLEIEETRWFSEEDFI